MLEHLWVSVVRVAGDWDWSTIAAFVAVAVTIRLARSNTRENRRQLRQAAVIDLNEHMVTWTTVATIYLDDISGYLEGRIAQSVIGPAAADRISAATGRLDRSLKAASMVVPDPKMVAALTAAQLQVVSFLQLFRNPAPQSPEEERSNLTRVVTDGRAIVKQFDTGAGPLVLRGLKLYRLSRGVTFGPRVRLATMFRRETPEPPASR